MHHTHKSNKEHEKSNRKPPGLLSIFLYKLINKSINDEAIEDFEERYNRVCGTKGVFVAFCWYLFQIMIVLPEFISGKIYRSTVMFKHYFKITFRNIVRQKFYSFVNVVGLSLGLASCIIIALYVADELAYDNFHEHGENIYRLNHSGIWGEDDFLSSTSPPPLAETLVSTFPEIESAVRIFRAHERVVRYSDKSFSETGVYSVDSTFFEIFSFPLIEGDPKSVLQNMYSVVLTESYARKYFGDEPAMGKIMLLGNERTPFTVSGIAENPPGNSHFSFNMLTPIASAPLVKRFSWSWIWTQVVTYVKLREGTSVPELEARFTDVIHAKAGPVIERFMGVPFKEFIDNGGYWDYSLGPIADIRLNRAGFGNSLGGTGSVAYIYIFSAIAVFIMILGCINFMNLATARSANRAKEVGVRKVMGSYKKDLVRQFLFESMVFSFSAMLVGILLAKLFIIPFNTISTKNLVIDFFAQGWLLAGLIGATIFVGLVSGSYPAFYLTSFKPVDVLKGKIRTGIKSGRLRSYLVVCQFSISIGLIVCTLLVNNQLQFMRQKDLGFDKENILIVHNADRLGESKTSFKESMKNESQILNASITTGVPTRYGFTDYYYPENSSIQDLPLTSLLTDYDLLNTLGIEIVKGRGFSKEFGSDSRSILINETTANMLGWDEPLGKTFTYPGNKNQVFTVVGVLKDFNFFSLHENVSQFAMFHESSNTYTINTYVVFRLRPGDLSETISLVKERWHQFAADAPFDYSFLDEDIDALYQSDESLGRIFSIFTGMAIFIACLGLLGLAGFTAEQRTKEIGIRKVLGSTELSVIRLLSQDFTRWVITANIIAWPLAYYFMERWLQNFAYRTNINVTTFLISGVLALGIALLTVGFQAIKAARTNPVNALKYE